MRQVKWMALVLIAGAACAAAPAETPSGPCVPAASEEAGAEPLTRAEALGLAQMREEEKLARDVYAALYKRWELRPFHNISTRGETHHFDAMGRLLERYALSDPAAGKEAGTFEDPGMQALYSALVERGNRSLVDALRVGAEIEEMDIADLQRVRRETDREDVLAVYQRLEQGSERHLRVFMRQLERHGAEYEPTHLSRAAFDAILAATPPGRSGGREGGAGNGCSSKRGCGGKKGCGGGGDKAGCVGGKGCRG